MIPKIKILFFDIYLPFIIIVNLIVTIFETEPNYIEHYNSFSLVDQIIFGSFMIEYIIRIIHSIRHKEPYILTRVGILDLVAISPIFFPIEWVENFGLLKLIKLLRLLKIFRLSKYIKTFSILERVFVKNMELLILSGFMSFIILLLASILMFSVENIIQPDEFPSVSATMWWAISTFTTIGYGDVYPVTTIGKLISASIALFGIAIFAIPTGIISAGFIHEYHNARNGSTEKKRRKAPVQKLSRRKFNTKYEKKIRIRSR